MGSDRSRSIVARIDRLLYALFARRADRPRHSPDRDRYRGTTISVDFDTYLSRIYGLSWLLAVVAAIGVALLGTAVTLSRGGILRTIVTALPITEGHLLAGMAIGGGLCVKRAAIATGMVYLRWRSNARRAAIERSLPGAVRYLHALADGSERHRVMLRKVAEQDAYGETSVAFARVVETAALTGSLDTGLRTVARETPSREVLSPFLLKFREHASQGSDSLEEFLRMESRMLAHQRSRARQRASDYLELLAELLVVLLVAPALLVLAVTVASAFVPGLSRTVPVFGRPTVRTLLVSGSSTFVLLVGGCAAILTARLRPSNYGRSYERPTGIETLTTMTENPASAAFVFAFPAVAFGWLLWTLGQPIANALLLGYAAYGFPVGAVAVSREQIDDAKDREIRDFVHAVAGHVRLGKPFGAAVEAVASEIDFGPLGDDIDALAFGLGLTTGTAGMDARREALDRFVDRVGTPLAEQTVGLVTGALDVGSDAETAFETLQTEVGALYHQRKELRSAMFVYVAVGWIVALLTVGVVVAVASYVLGGAVQLPVDAPDAAGREIRQLYLLTQSTMLACGWFAGVASRGRYEALLHSSALVAICHVAFVGAGLI